jgi:hypothetical protein
MVRALALLALLVVATPSSIARADGQSGYTVSRTANGIQLTLHFAHQNYPKRALIAVTATVRNLSHPNLAIQRSRLNFGICSAPSIQIVAVNAKGQSAEPVSPIPPLIPPCPYPGTVDLPVGHVFVERQLVTLWSSRLQITASVLNHIGRSYQGFPFHGPAVRLHLYHVPAPTISIQQIGGSTVAAVSPRVAVRGPLYYISWGNRNVQQNAPVSAYYWTPANGRVVSCRCSNPTQWHLEVAWLNTPVAILNLGATTSQ